MLRVLGGEVEERQQHVGVLLQRHQGLRVLRTILDREPPDGLAHLRAGLGVHHLAQRGLHAQLEALRELIDDVAELVEPVALLARSLKPPPEGLRWALLGLVGPHSRPKHGQTLWPRDAR